MIYAKNIDIPNWKKLQQDIIYFKKNQGAKELWWAYFEDEINMYIPDLIPTFNSMGLTVRQMILFDNLPNNITVTDPTNLESMFIHTDSKDSKDSKDTIESPQPFEIEFSTNFEPTCALNIPLENCENSFTLWYKLKDTTKPDVYYPHYDCGGHDILNCVEVFKFKLENPSVIRIDVPHAVYNPTKEIRSVATFRFYEDLQQFL